MKKLMTIAAAALCASVFADGITSANVVGYQTISGLTGDQFKALAVQFENVAGGEIAVKDLVAVGTSAGGNSLSDGADQIWRWDTENAKWTKYFYRSARGKVTGWCKSGETAETTDTVPAGETFFFRRGSGSSETDLTLAGAVKEFKGSAQYSASGDQLVFMANPWPFEIVIKDFANYQTTPAGGNSLSDGADQIWRWDTENAKWTKYFYKSARGKVTGWCKSGETTATEDKIPVGEGFFFRRGSGSATDTITFSAPSAE